MFNYTVLGSAVIYDVHIHRNNCPVINLQKEVPTFVK